MRSAGQSRSQLTGRGMTRMGNRKGRSRVGTSDGKGDSDGKWKRLKQKGGTNGGGGDSDGKQKRSKQRGERTAAEEKRQ